MTLREYLESWDKEYLNEGIGDKIKSGIGKIKKFSKAAIIAAILAGSIVSNPTPALGLNLDYDIRSVETDSEENKDFNQDWYESITKHPLTVGIEDRQNKNWRQVYRFIGNCYEELNYINRELENKYGKIIEEKEKNIIRSISRLDYKDYDKVPNRKFQMEEKFKDECMKIRKKYQEKLRNHLTEGFTDATYAGRPDWDASLNQLKEHKERFVNRYEKISEEFFKEYIAFLNDKEKVYSHFRKELAPTFKDKAENIKDKAVNKVKKVF